nr:immunoglobulin heavy chain junction region [Mus musculus]MBK4186283.1 immunoglobulin heavy chain junction region [Mus musculus]MBK4198507.1 immunoglobulin heavy chain junction region [Mus musculus]MBK4198508.1 immunoglobulin heavy chain junction region [Mus musculus]MBK4198509.1 immunoglobulin heavy chain junction region [Mus musculus]
CARLGYYFDYW